MQNTGVGQKADRKIRKVKIMMYQDDITGEVIRFQDVVNNKKKRCESGGTADREAESKQSEGQMEEGEGGYKIKVVKWALYSDSPKLLKALTGKFGARERIKAKKEVFELLMCQKMPHYELLRIFCCVSLIADYPNELIAALKPRTLRDVVENLNILKEESESTSGFGLRDVLIGALVELALSYECNKSFLEKDKEDFVKILSIMMEIEDWDSIAKVFDFNLKKDWGDSAFFPLWEEGDAEWSVKMIPPINYLCELLLEKGCFGEAYYVRQNHRLVLSEKGLGSSCLDSPWKTWAAQAKEGLLKPLSKKELGGSSISVMEKITSEGLLKFAQGNFIYEYYLCRVQMNLLKSDIKKRCIILCGQNQECQNILSAELKKCYTEISRNMKICKEKTLHKRKILNFALSGLEMFLALAEDVNTGLKKDYLSELVAIISDAAAKFSAGIATAARKREGEDFKEECENLLGVLFSEMIARLFEMGKIYRTVREFSDITPESIRYA